METTNRRGRAYTCRWCERNARSYVAEKRRVVLHIMKQHLSLDEVPFHCRACHFFCQTERKFNQHVSTNSAHRQKEERLQMEGRMLEDIRIVNINPYSIGEADMVAKTKEESAQIFLGRQRGASSPAAETDILTLAAESAGGLMGTEPAEHILSQLPREESIQTPHDDEASSSSSTSSISSTGCHEQLVAVKEALERNTLNMQASMTNLTSAMMVQAKSIEAVAEAIKGLTTVIKEDMESRNGEKVGLDSGKPVLGENKSENVWRGTKEVKAERTSERENVEDKKKKEVRSERREDE